MYTVSTNISYLSKMSSAKMQKYCRITQYLQDNYPVLFKCVEDLCMFGVLTPRKSGLTFLIPDTAIIKEIDSLTHGKNPEKAAEMIRALTLPVYYADIVAFDANKTKLKTLAGFNLDIKNISPDNITLTNGSKISTESKFQPFEGKSNIAVYKINGPIQMSGKTSGAGISGGFDPGYKNSITKYINHLEASYKVGITSGANPYVDAVVSLLDYTQVKDGNKFKQALTILDYDPVVSFYIYMNFDKLFSESFISDWIANGIKPYGGVKAYMKYLEMIDTVGGDLGDPKKRSEVREQIKAYRSQIFGDGATKEKIPTAALEKYSSWIGLFPVYGGDARLKFLHDEFRNLASALLDDANDPASVNEALEEIGLYLIGTKKGKTMFGDCSRTAIGNELFHATCLFICTNDYFYLPATPIEAAAIPGASENQKVPSNGLVFTNVFKKKLEALKSFKTEDPPLGVIKINAERAGLLSAPSAPQPEPAPAVE